MFVKTMLKMGNKLGRASTLHSWKFYFGRELKEKNLFFIQYIKNLNPWYYKEKQENVDNSQTHTQKEHIKIYAPPKTRTLS